MAKHELETEDEGASSNKKPRISKSKETQPDTPKEPAKTFFDLPGEIRNDIYRLALVDEDPIMIDHANHTQPGALRTCRQMREESRSIFTQENTFNYPVFDCVPKIPKTDTDFWLWNSDIPELIRPEIVGDASWDNLLRWIEEYFHDERQRPPVRWSSDGVAVILRAFDIAEKLKEYRMDWMDAEGCLLDFKYAVQAGMEDENQVWARDAQ